MPPRFGGPRLAGKSLSNSFSRRGRTCYSGDYDPARETTAQALGAYGPCGANTDSSRPVQLYGRSTDVNDSSRGTGASRGSGPVPGAYAGKNPRAFIKY